MPEGLFALKFAIWTMVARTELRDKGPFLGATGTISAWNLHVEGKEWSLNSVTVFNKDQSFMENGWAEPASSVAWILYLNVMDSPVCICIDGTITNGTCSGVVKFDPATGKQFKKSSQTLSYTNYFADALIAEAEVDKNIVAIHAAMGGITGLNYFKRRFPDRCFDVGIAEQHAVTFAAGLACEGIKPFCAIYSSFLQRAYDQSFLDEVYARVLFYIR